MKINEPIDTSGSVRPAGTPTDIVRVTRTTSSKGASVVVTTGQAITAHDSKFRLLVPINVNREIQKAENLRQNRMILKKTTYGIDD